MKTLILILNISIGNILFANTGILGKWKINHLIKGNEYEYVLGKADSKYPWGNHVEFKTDSTFYSGYSAWCGNDCFTNTYGTYLFTDENHIRLILKRITVHGDCAHSDTTMIQDLGLFYIYKDTAIVKIIPSNGDLRADLQKTKYSKAIDDFDNETREVYNFICIRSIPIKSKAIEDVVAEYFQSQKDTGLHFNSGDLNILYSKIIREDNIIVLLEEKTTKKYYYLVIDNGRVNRNAGLYNPVAFKKCRDSINR